MERNSGQQGRERCSLQRQEEQQQRQDQQQALVSTLPEGNGAPRMDDFRPNQYDGVGGDGAERDGAERDGCFHRRRRRLRRRCEAHDDLYRGDGDGDGDVPGGCERHRKGDGDLLVQRQRQNQQRQSDAPTSSCSMDYCLGGMMDVDADSDADVSHVPNADMKEEDDEEIKEEEEEDDDDDVVMSSGRNKGLDEKAGHRRQQVEGADEAAPTSDAYAIKHEEEMDQLAVMLRVENDHAVFLEPVIPPPPPRPPASTSLPSGESDFAAATADPPPSPLTAMPAHHHCPLYVHSPPPSLPRIEWRSRICDWYYRIIDRFSYDREVAAAALNLFDRYLVAISTATTTTKEPPSRIDPSTYQLAATACLYLAVKLHNHAVDDNNGGGSSSNRDETPSPCERDESGDDDDEGGGDEDKRVRRRLERQRRLQQQQPQFWLATFASLSRNQFTEGDIASMELSVLMTLRWRVHPPTAASFAGRILRLLLLFPSFSSSSPSSSSAAAEAATSPPPRPDFAWPSPPSSSSYVSSLVVHILYELSRYLVELSACLPELAATTMRRRTSDVAYAAVSLSMDLLCPSCVVPPEVREALRDWMADATCRSHNDDDARQLKSTMRTLLLPEVLLTAFAVAKEDYGRDDDGDKEDLEEEGRVEGDGEEAEVEARAAMSRGVNGSRGTTGPQRGEQNERRQRRHPLLLARDAGLLHPSLLEGFCHRLFPPDVYFGADSGDDRQGSSRYHHLHHHHHHHYHQVLPQASPPLPSPDVAQQHREISPTSVAEEANSSCAAAAVAASSSSSSSISYCSAPSSVPHDGSGSGKLARRSGRRSGDPTTSGRRRRKGRKRGGKGRVGRSMSAAAMGREGSAKGREEAAAALTTGEGATSSSISSISSIASSTSVTTTATSVSKTTMTC